MVQEVDNLQNVPQDAVHGQWREEPDAHLYFGWHMGEGGVKFSHFEVVFTASADECVDPIAVAAQTQNHVAAKSDKNKSHNAFDIEWFFNTSRYAGHGYKFPELKGKLDPSEVASDWRPAMLKDLVKVFDQSTYNLVGHRFPELPPGRIKVPEGQCFNQEAAEKMFGKPVRMRQAMHPSPIHRQHQKSL